MTQPAPLKTPAVTLEELLALHDEAFVQKAYMVILGRKPDAGGLANYLAHVRGGAEKSHILAELAKSPEGMLRNIDLPGMRNMLSRYPKRAPSILSRLFRRLTRSSIEPTERQLRVIDNKLYLLEQSLARQSRQLADLLTLVQGTTLPSGNYKPNSYSSEGDTKIQAPPLSHLSPKLGLTFIELKAAIATKQSN
jgi:Domain of unknown function (DUF4214)